MKKLTEQEIRVLQDVRKANDHPDGFRSYIPMSGGSKGANFARINLKRRIVKLLGDGMLAPTPHGYEITDAGRKALAIDT